MTGDKLQHKCRVKWTNLLICAQRWLVNIPWEDTEGKNNKLWGICSDTTLHLRLLLSPPRGNTLRQSQRVKRCVVTANHLNWQVSQPMVGHSPHTLVQSFNVNSYRCRDLWNPFPQHCNVCLLLQPKVNKIKLFVYGRQARCISQLKLNRRRLYNDVHKSLRFSVALRFMLYWGSTTNMLTLAR